METFLSTLTPMATLFFCIAVGFVLKKANVFSGDAGKVMAKMVTWVFFPALNFVTMARYCTVDTLSLHATNLVLSSISVALAMSIAIFLSRYFVKQKCAELGIYRYALTFANSGYVGDPIVLAMFGDAALAQYKLFCLPLTLVIYTWGTSILTPSDANKGSAFKRLLNPTTTAMLCGIVVGLLGVGDRMPAFLNSTLDSFKACMGPVAMLLAGVTIARYDFIGMLKKAKVYIATALRLVFIPVVLIAALYGLKTLAGQLFGLSIDNDVLFLCFFACATPLGLNTVIFPEAYGGDPETGASMAMISHTLCVVSIPVLYAVMVALFGAPFGG